MASRSAPGGISNVSAAETVRNRRVIVVTRSAASVRTFVRYFRVRGYAVELVSSACVAGRALDANCSVVALHGDCGKVAEIAQLVQALIVNCPSCKVLRLIDRSQQQEKTITMPSDWAPILYLPCESADVRIALANKKTGVEGTVQDFIKNYVGVLTMPDLLVLVRETMVLHAMRQCGGSRRSAAKLLGVSRQAIQQQQRRRSSSESR